MQMKMMMENRRMMMKTIAPFMKIEVMRTCHSLMLSHTLIEIPAQGLTTGTTC